MDLESRDNLWAVVVDGLVIDVVIWDGESEWTPPDGAELVKLVDAPGVGIGWTYNPKATKNKWIDNRPEPEDPTDGPD